MSSLRLNELIVVRGDNYVYHEKFNHKINIIRGNNSTGKSSLSNFIFFILGGDFTEFLPEAKSCDYVFAELLINDIPITVRRDLTKNSKGNVMSLRPMWINVAPLSKAINSQISGWKIYPYSQTENQESFSQKIFQLLNFPSISSENQETVTLNQILRLIYIDQLSNLNDLMRSEDFDSPAVRDAIGNLLLGTYSDRKLQLEKHLRIVKKEYEKISTQLSAMEDVFDESSLDYNSQSIESKIDELKNQLEKINEIIANPAGIIESVKPNVPKEKLDSARTSLIQLKNKYQTLVKQLEETTVAYYDSKDFIKVIKDRINDIDISINTRKSFGSLELKTCPSCFEKLEESSENNCNLCKQEIPDELNLTKFYRMKLELEMQLKESNNLIVEREDNIKNLNRRIKETSRNLEEAQLDYDRITGTVNSSTNEKIQQIFEEKGSIKYHIKYLFQQLDLVSSYEEYRIRFEQLKSQETHIKIEIQQLDQDQNKKAIKAYTTINYYALKLIRADGHYEDKFETGKKTSISFRDNKYYLDNRNRFSASSMVVLKNCIRFAIFFASVKLDFFRYPKFILCDNIEDKGMSDERSQNFQRQIVEIAESKEFENKEFQIIFTTSKIADELNIPDYTVGKYYTPELKSLNFEGVNKS